MNFISRLLRFMFRQYQVLGSLMRVTKINLLYPGAEIDYQTTIESNCSIVCVNGGKLKISGSTVKAGTNIVADANSVIAIEESFIGRNCVITAKQQVLIKKGCLIAEMVVIRDQDHASGQLSKDSANGAFTVAAIQIGEHVWIAAKATILKGVIIGNNAVIGASAVVTKNIPAGEIWAGVPARFLKHVDEK